MKKILITCFEPFGNHSENASMHIACRLPERIADFSVEKLILPVEFERSAQIAKKEAVESGAKYVICFGEARGRRNITPELLAINLQYASIPDNAGKKPCDVPISEGGSSAIFTRFKARLLAEKINEKGVAAALSYSAGAYVCNDLYYRLLEYFENSDVNVLFIHVPVMDEEGYGKASAAIADAVKDTLDSMNLGV